MFEDSLIESGGKLKTKRGRTSIVAFLHRVHDHRRDGSDSADFHRSLAQGHK